MFRARRVGDHWDQVRAELERAFRTSQEAVKQGQSLVYVVHQDDLLGRTGPGNAMVATGLLSAARTVAMEGAKEGWTVNVVAHDDEAAPEEVESCVDWLLSAGAVTGELIRIGPGHIGKTLP